jgi:hypothetical protein
MKDVAYLLATLDQLRYTVEIIDAQSCEFNGDIWIKYTVRNKTKHHNTEEYTRQFNAKDLASTLNYDWSNIKPRINTFVKLLDLKIILGEDIDYCCFLNWKQTIEAEVRYAEIQGDKVKYRQRSTTNLIPIKYNLDKVLAAEGILDGLTILDYAGSHYTVVTPAKKEHLTTGVYCSCREFISNKRCSHSKLVSLLPEHRRLLMEYNLLQVKF